MAAKLTWPKHWNGISEFTIFVYICYILLSYLRPLKYGWFYMILRFYHSWPITTEQPSIKQTILKQYCLHKPCTILLPSKKTPERSWCHLSNDTLRKSVVLMVCIHLARGKLLRWWKQSIKASVFTKTSGDVCKSPPWRGVHRYLARIPSIPNNKPHLGMVLL